MSGKKTKTFRLGDNHLTKFVIGDTISLIKTSDQTPFGVAQITGIASIRFDEIPLIPSGHESYNSVQDKKIIFKRIYGKDIGDHESISVVEFKLSDGRTSQQATQQEVFSPTADFIAEGLDQTRGWFRSLHVISNAYMDTIAFKNVAVT